MPRQGTVDWTAICRAIGKPELEKDPRFDNPKVRRANAAELVDILDAAFAAHDTEYWRAKLDAEDMIWAPLMRPADVYADPGATQWFVLSDLGLSTMLGTDGLHVTVRRLNRTEYNNTVRDLTAVDFNAAENFPADDIGHGFGGVAA